MMTQEYGYVLKDTVSTSEGTNFQRIVLPPILLKIEKKMVTCGSMMYFPPLDVDDERHTLSSEGPLSTIKVHWGDVVPGSVLLLSDTHPPEELVEVRIRWSMFMPGIVLYFSGCQEIPIKIRNHPMVLVVPWKETRFCDIKSIMGK